MRKLAKKFDLPTHAKKDSQGVCFVGELNMHDFLTEYIKPQKGDIIYDGNVVGEHDGSAYFTIGQRHGLNITIGGGPYYVVRKEQNKIYVEKSKTKSQKAMISELHWIGVSSKHVAVKVRYRTESVSAELRDDFLLFGKPVTAITPGQSAVFYRGREVLGGGILQSSQ